MLRSIFILLLTVFSLFAQDIIYDVQAIVVPADTSKAFYELEVFAEGHPQSYLANPGNFGTVDGHPILLVPMGALVKFKGQVTVGGQAGIFKVRPRYSKEWLDNNTLVIGPGVEFVQLQLCGLDKDGNVRASFLLEVVVRPEVKPVVKVVDESKYKKYLFYKKRQLTQVVEEKQQREFQLRDQLLQVSDLNPNWIGVGLGSNFAGKNSSSVFYQGQFSGMSMYLAAEGREEGDDGSGYYLIGNFFLQPVQTVGINITVGQMAGNFSSFRERSYFSVAAMKGFQLSDFTAVFLGADMGKYFRSNTDQGGLPAPASYGLTFGLSQVKGAGEVMTVMTTINGDVWRGLDGTFGSFYLSNLLPLQLYNAKTVIEISPLWHLLATNDNFFILAGQISRGDGNYLYESLFDNNYREFSRQISGFILWNTKVISGYLSGKYRSKQEALKAMGNGPLEISGGLFLPVDRVKIGLSGQSDLQGGNQIGLNVIWKL